MTGMIARTTILAALAIAFAQPASALEVVYDDRTPAESREWADRHYIREQMEVLAVKICKALYGSHSRSSLHENFKITLYLAPVKGGNPAFAAGRRITWKVGKEPGGDGSGGMGLLAHEMTHVLDMGSDSVFTEAMADWVRNYRVWYHRCSNPPYILDIRHKALRGSRKYGKYLAGAHFIDFMTQTYGEGTIYKILLGYKQHGRDPWKKLFGKDFDALIAEWRQMETIYDPVFQWSYNGTAAGVVRKDKSFCSLKTIAAHDAADKSGAWLNGATAGRVEKLVDGNMTIALHGWLPNGGNPVAIASLGAAKENNGKAVLLASEPRRDMLTAYVVANLPGRSAGIVSRMAIAVPKLASSPHSVVLTTRGGDEAEVVVDGRPGVKIDMKSRCRGCTFVPAFAVGGISGGIGIAGISEPRGKSGMRLDDVRIFSRSFRARETASYAATFNADFRPAVAVTAKWCGPQGGTELDKASNWFCVNSVGEKIEALPSKGTDVVVCGKSIPNIPQKARFECKSFTIDGWAVADEANIDLRGVKVVDLADNTRIITRGHTFAVSALKAKRLRLDGALAVLDEMKVEGNLEMKSESRLRLPSNPEKAFAKSISIKGEGTVTLRPGAATMRGRMQRLLRMDEMPKDLTRFRLSTARGSNAAEFKSAANGKFLAATPLE